MKLDSSNRIQLLATGQDPRFKLALDARWLQSGIGTYTWNLLLNLQPNKKFQIRVITSSANAERLRPYVDEVVICDAKIYSASEQWRIPKCASGADLLHIPHYNYPIFRGGATIVTIHDLTHILDPKYRRGIKAWLYARPMLRIAARRAVHIITGSQYTKKNLVEHLGVDPEKISVIYYGVSPLFRPVEREEALGRIRQTVAIDKRYLLYVGNLKPHKRVDLLLLAFAQVARQIDCKLLVVSSDPSSFYEMTATRLKIASDVQFLRGIPNELLPAMYSAAEAGIVCSREEGFGLPVIESMACGTPVICSNAASLPEVTGDAACMFQSGDVDELAAQMIKVVGNAELRASLREKGLRRAAEFTWQRAGALHAQVYEKVFQENVA